VFKPPRGSADKARGLAFIEAQNSFTARPGVRSYGWGTAVQPLLRIQIRPMFGFQAVSAGPRVRARGQIDHRNHAGQAGGVIGSNSGV